MAIAAQSIIQRCVQTLQDPTSIRWPVAELVRYLNDGQREVILHRPDAAVKRATVTLTAGKTIQNLPAGGTKLIDVVRNTDGSAVRLTNREILDAQQPGWHKTSVDAHGTTILHYMYDPRDPTVFYVYPVPKTGASLEVVYSATPTPVSEANLDGVQYTSVTGDIGLPDIYGNVLQDYILYRAYSKDSEYAGNAQRAQAHYAAFANALGIEIKATVAVAPNPIHNPNRPAMTGTPN